MLLVVNLYMDLLKVVSHLQYYHLFSVEAL